MRFAFGRELPRFIASLCAACVVSMASPALANTTASTAAEVTKPVEEAQAEALAKGDASFRDLFASWTALDTAGPDPFATDVTTSAPVPVAVPSRSPLEWSRLSSS